MSVASTAIKPETFISVKRKLFRPGCNLILNEKVVRNLCGQSGTTSRTTKLKGETRHQPGKTTRRLLKVRNKCYFSHTGNAFPVDLVSARLRPVLGSCFASFYGQASKFSDWFKACSVKRCERERFLSRKLGTFDYSIQCIPLHPTHRKHW